MMNPVFEKTRELAEAIQQSEEFITMKAAEEKAMRNEEAAAAMAEYLEKRQLIEKMLESGTAKPEELKQVSQEMELAQQKMQMVPDIVKLSESRDAFSELINQVNKVLRFMLTGEEDEEENVPEGGCTGSCATCGGCTGKVN